MSAKAGEQSIEAILQLLLDGLGGEALSAIGVEFGKSTAEECGFTRRPLTLPEQNLIASRKSARNDEIALG
jgi:hypothetical protein